ncbi:MAG: L-seryl-tRNA(Sec) selenium transferase [Acidobacteriota bacterium]
MAAQRSKTRGGRQAALLRRLPSIDRVLDDPGVGEWARRQGHGRGFVRRAANRFLEQLRQATMAEEIDAVEIGASLDNLVAGVSAAADELTRFQLQTVINATGVIVHTNLGRSPWSAAAAERVASLSRHYLNLEFDLGGGTRGHRDAPVERLFQRLFPDSDVAVVNNNAAAVLLALNTLADGKEVVVSRGQLVEIGGSFRIPEVMAKSGSILREVGTTNRTRLSDYEAAIGEQTGMLLSVHPSNYRVVGFTESVPLADLVELGHAHHQPVVEDMGSGNLLDLEAYGVPGEPSVGERLATGVDMVTFSGDKLLGGPQAGFIAGKPDYIGRVRANPLYRALRLDKAITLALEATLVSYIAGRIEELPTLTMLAISPDLLRDRAESLADRLRSALPAGRAHVSVVEVSSRVGGGAAPELDLPSFAVAVEVAEGPDRLAADLRQADPPVIARIVDDRLLMDVRTLLPGEEDQLIVALQRIA